MTALPQDFSKTRFRFLVVSEMCLFQRAIKWLSNVLHEPFVRANIKQNLLQTEQVDSRLTSLALARAFSAYAVDLWQGYSYICTFFF